MKNNQSETIKARGTLFNGAAPVRMAFLAIVVLWALLLLAIPLAHFFPALVVFFQPIYLLILVGFLGLILLMLILGFGYIVWIEPEGIAVRLCGIPLHRIPPSELCLFCAAGNDREDVLCFSRVPMGELALREEQRLSRGWLTRSEVPFRKQKAGWQDTFAGEYLFRQLRHPLRLLTSRELVMLPMDPVLLILIRRQYPDLPYRNITTVRSCFLSPSEPAGTPEDRAASLLSGQSIACTLALETTGISICPTKGESLFLPADRFRLLLQVDCFYPYSKFFPHHLPLLFISCLTTEELAARAPKRIYGIFREELSDDPELLAFAAASRLARRWTARRKDYLVMYCTEKNYRRFRELYPDVPVLCQSDLWL